MAISTFTHRKQKIGRMRDFWGGGGKSTSFLKVCVALKALSKEKKKPTNCETECTRNSIVITQELL